MDSSITEKNRKILNHVTSRLDILIDHFGEEITLRELRVRMLLFKEFAKDPDAEVSYAHIAHETGVPASTLTRYLTFCLVDKCMSERVDPKDRRRRLLRLGPAGLERMETFLNSASVNGFGT